MTDLRWELNTGDLPDTWAGHCNDCVQPITAEPWWKTAFYWLCYRIVLASPWMPWPLLPFAGAYGYACRCPNRRAALRAARHLGGRHD